jgi:hypothetical protein
MRLPNTKKRQLTTQIQTNATIKCDYQRNLASEHTKRKPDFLTSEPETKKTTRKKSRTKKPQETPDAGHQETPSRARPTVLLSAPCSRLHHQESTTIHVVQHQEISQRHHKSRQYGSLTRRLTSRFNSPCPAISGLNHQAYRQT